MDRLNEGVSYGDLESQNENFSGNLPEEEKEMMRLCIESS